MINDETADQKLKRMLLAKTDLSEEAAVAAAMVLEGFRTAKQDHIAPDQDDHV